MVVLGCCASSGCALSLAFGCSLTDFAEFVFTVFDHGDEFGMLIPEILGCLEGIQCLTSIMALEAKTSLFLLDEIGELIVVDEARGTQLAGGAADGFGHALEKRFVIAVDKKCLSEFDPCVEGALLGKCNQPVALKSKQLFVEVEHFDSMGCRDQVSSHGTDGDSHVLVFDHGTRLLGGEVPNERTIADHFLQRKRCFGGDKV